VSIQRIHVRPADLGLLPERSGIAANPAGTPFAKVLDQCLTDVRHLQFQSSGVGRGTLEGTLGEIRDIMLAAEEAGVAFELLEELRNSLVEAYKEIMRIQV
jgi:flagellar hook-basal body complex protein FliE